MTPFCYFPNFTALREGVLAGIGVSAKGLRIPSTADELAAETRSTALGRIAQIRILLEECCRHGERFIRRN